MKSRKRSGAAKGRCHQCSEAPVWPEIHLHFHAAPTHARSASAEARALSRRRRRRPRGIEPQFPGDEANVVVQSGNIGYICATGSIRGPVDRVFAKITQTAPGPCPAFNDPVDPIALGLTEGELTPFGSAHIYCFEMVPDASVRATNHIRILAVVEVDGVLRSRGCKDNTFEGNADGETDCEAGPSLCD